MTSEADRVHQPPETNPLHGRIQQVMSTIYAKARKRSVRIVFPEGDEPKILRAAQILAEEGICTPILLGESASIRPLIEEQRLSKLNDVKIIQPASDPNFDRYVAQYWDLRKRRGTSMTEARRLIGTRNYFAAMMVRNGSAEGMVTGLTTSYPEGIRAPLEIIRTKDEQRAGGVYIVVLKDDFKFFADCTVTIDPTAEELAEIAIRTADLARHFDLTPRIAMLSYSNFGSAAGPSPTKVKRAAGLVQVRRPDLEVDGEIQVDTASVREVRMENFPFCRLTDDANVLVFPNLDAANIAYKLLWRLGGAEVIGPVLLGMHRPVNVLQMGASVSDIVNLAAFTALRAQGEFAF
ncbi:MAG TPA: phosphate acyltransferase [Myxococcaceae bacterium]|nr:phosphate acyltransferase [Myxococcaceae bacterium]